MAEEHSKAGLFALLCASIFISFPLFWYNMIDYQLSEEEIEDKLKPLSDKEKERIKHLIEKATFDPEFEKELAEEGFNIGIAEWTEY